MDPAGPSQEAIHVEVYVLYDQMDAAEQGQIPGLGSRPPSCTRPAVRPNWLP